ncbi:hypothetical protein L9F63_003906, partial [Diploptera punctata]
YCIHYFAYEDLTANGKSDPTGLPVTLIWHSPPPDYAKCHRRNNETGKFGNEIRAG